MTKLTKLSMNMSNVNSNFKKSKNVIDKKLEDASISRAIRIGKKTKKITRKLVFDILLKHV